MKALISDLGGVLVHFSHNQMCKQIAEVCGIPYEKVWVTFFEPDPLFGNQSLGTQLECGTLTNKELYLHLCTIANRTIDPEALLQAACTIFKPNEEMISFIEKVKKKSIRLILLSNTSEAHFTFIKKHFSFISLFDAAVLSYEVKACKPEKKIYLAALEAAGHPAADCFYIDDVAEYVFAAQRLGIPSHTFTEVNQLFPYLNT